MAYTEFQSGHPLSPVIWERELAAEAIQQTYVWSFMGKGANALLVNKTDFSTKAGDKLVMGLRPQLTGRGTTGDDTLHGNEEALVTYSDQFVINQLRHAVISKGRMSEQRVAFNMRNEAKEGLADWFATRFDTWFFNQIGGATYQTDTAYTRYVFAVPAGATVGFSADAGSAAIQSAANNAWTATVSSAVTSIVITAETVANV